jgi:hypothetical protein
MVVPFVLLLLSLAGVAASLAVRPPADLLLIAGPCAIAAAILLARAAMRPRPLLRDHRDAPAPPPPANPILVDGSNVMHWKDGAPEIATLRAVVDRLRDMGFNPGVVFDANAGYKVAGRYLDDAPLADLLDLPADRVLVVPKGTQADTILLRAARDMGARIVTNDRYRDWAEAHPEVARPGHLIRGGFRDGQLWLALEAEMGAQPPG